MEKFLFLYSCAYTVRTTANPLVGKKTPRDRAASSEIPATPMKV